MTISLLDNHISIKLTKKFLCLLKFTLDDRRGFFPPPFLGQTCKIKLDSLNIFADDDNNNNTHPKS